MHRAGVRPRQLGRTKKKLEDAAHYWATGGGAVEDDDRVSSLIEMGVPEEEARAFVQDSAESDELEDFDVFPENWDTVILFHRLQTQWRVAGMGGLIGLDYVAVESVMRICKVKNREQTFDRLRVMEAAALEAMSDANQC